MFPNAAAANRSIFYDKQGSARGVADVYAELNARYASAAGASATQKALAMYGGSPENVQLASAAPPVRSTMPALDSASFLSQIPDVRSVTPVAASSNAGNNSQAPDPIFRSLFQVDERSQPVSSTVRELWGRSSSLTSDAAHIGRPIEQRRHAAPARSLQRSRRHILGLIATCV